MELFAFTYQNHRFVLNGSSWSGQEELLVDDVVVSHLRNFGMSSLHNFTVDGLGELQLAFTIDLLRGLVAYQLRAGEALLTQGTVAIAAAYLQQREQVTAVASGDAPAANETAAPARKSGHWLVMVGVGLKLFKSVKVFKVALAAASLSVYSILFTVEFALALIAILVFHEYGHLRAMKKFGIPTKGMYLIPFVGGLAVGDKPTTRWQDVYISLMGPIYGLLMTVVCYIGYLLTDSHFIGLVASFSALINLFNLLPIYPLDGGRVLKSVVFSGRKYIALVFLLTLSALFFVASLKFGFALIGFFIVLGVVDILSEWKVSLAEDITPLTPYGIWFCLGWYVLTIAAFLGIIVLIANSGLPGSEIALAVLNS